MKKVKYLRNMTSKDYEMDISSSTETCKQKLCIWLIGNDKEVNHGGEFPCYALLPVIAKKGYTNTAIHRTAQSNHHHKKKPSALHPPLRVAFFPLLTNS